MNVRDSVRALQSIVMFNTQLYTLMCYTVIAFGVLTVPRSHCFTSYNEVKIVTAISLSVCL